MRISELSERSGVSVATLKYYLREGLLHAGELQGATRAVYDESHLERLRLVRTLVDVGHLSIERVREVVQAIDAPPGTRHDLLGAAHEALRPPAAAGAPSPEALARVAGLGLPDCEHSAAALQLAHALTAAEARGWAIEPATLAVWLRAMHQVAQTDVVAQLGEVSASEALRYAILGNVLTDPVLLALRRVAQEAVSAERFGTGPTG